MFKFVVVVAMLACGVYAAPQPKPLVVASPIAVAPAVVTAQSSQVIARNYNTLAAPLVAAPAAIAYTQPIVKAASVVSAPVVAAPALASPYVAAAYSL